MIGIPSDVRSAAHAAYDTPIRDDGASLNSLVNKDAKEAVLAALETAIMTERRRHEITAARIDQAIKEE